MGPLLAPHFAERYETTWAGSATTTACSARGRRPDHGVQPRRASSATRSGPLLPPRRRRRRPPDDELFRVETFGPIVGVTTYRTLDEAIELANLPGYGLSSSIYTTNPTSAFRFRQGIGAGMVSVNNSTSGAEAHLPFGGNGKSGNGSGSRASGCSTSSPAGSR